MWAVPFFLKAMAPFMAIAAPFYLLPRFIYLRRRKTKINWPRELALLLFVLFMVGLASQTIIPRMKFGPEGVIFTGEGVHETRLQPFRVIEYTRKDLQVNQNSYSLVINLLGNIVMFMPIGFFLPLLWRTPFIDTVLSGMLISVIIELIQLLLPRWTDIDDVILNTLGAAAGFLLYKLLHLIFGKLLDCFSDEPTVTKTPSA